MNELTKQLTDIASDQKLILAQSANHQRTLDKHSEQLETIGDTLLRNTITVEQHERRSTSLEEEFKLHRARLETVEKSQDTTKTYGKIAAAVIAGVPTIATGLWYAFQFLKKLGI